MPLARSPLPVTRSGAARARHAAPARHGSAVARPGHAARSGMASARPTPAALDARACYRAMESRDARFEGRFVIAVRTTRIYCRPGCPAPIPLRKNVSFLPSPAAAEEAGYRPCARCRPDASPDTSAWLGTRATVSRALRLIDDEGIGEDGVDALADRLGVGGRHLRRLFSRHVGASPLAVANTRRVHFARKLLEETPLPVSEVAFAAGFSSIRRFNEAVLKTFRKPPTALRRRTIAAPTPRAPSEAVTLRLAYVPPYDRGELLGFFRGRAIPGVEHAGPDSYARTFLTAAGPAVLEVSPGDDGRSLKLSLWGPVSRELFSISQKARALFDLAADPRAVSRHLARDRALRPLVRARPGLRVPGAWDTFELTVRAILGQQVSVRAATTLAGRLVERFGARVAPGVVPAHLRPHLTHVFPSPADLGAARLTNVGLPGARAAALRGFAQSVASGKLRLAGHGGLEEAVAALTSMPGIGPWTAHYVAMRALREPDALPASDLGIRKALALLAAGSAGSTGSAASPGSGAGDLPSAAEVERRAELWRPWRAYAALHLWTHLAVAAE